MAFGIKLIPLNGINLDVANAYLPPNQARFIKNLYYQLSDTAEAGTIEGTEKGKLKPIESNAVYCPFELPEGDCTIIGTFPSRETKELYGFVHNSLNNHFIFRLNGALQTADISAPNSCFNFQLSPEYFIGEGQCYLDINTFVDPDTGQELIKKDLYWTDGYNYQGFIRFDDYLATNGFNEDDFTYFKGKYDKCTLVRVGLPTPKDCVTYTEVPHTTADDGLNNELLFQGLQVRITPIDVFGRPSEHGIISDLYIPGVNDCVAASNNLPRCLDLSIYVGNPLWDKIQVEFSNDNELQWYLDSVINLYSGSSLGQWWLRGRNPDVIYNPNTERITYRFCKTKECTPIPLSETNKLQPSLSKRAQAVGKVGKRLGFANNKYGFNPFPQSLKDKIHLTITPPQKDDSLRDITVYVCTQNGKGVAHKDDQYYFGGNANGNPTYAQEQLQLFPVGQKSWIGYLNDGSYTIGEQYFYDVATATWVADTNFAYGGKPGPVMGAGNFQTFVLQKFTFPKKQKGNYIFRLAGHRTDVKNTPNYQLTSTTVFGLCPFDLTTFRAYLNRDIYKSFEVPINICTNDYDTLVDGKILVIQDFGFTNSNNRPMNTQGYIYEDTTKIRPMELMDVSDPAGGSSSRQTDHNGFYWASSTGSASTFTFSFRNSCTDASFGKTLNSTSGTMIVTDIIINQQTGFILFDTIPCNRQLIKGRVVIEGTNIGVPNITVTLSRTTPTVTDADGNFTIIAHDEMFLTVRNDSIYLASGCGYTGQNGVCIMPIPAPFGVCTVCNGERILQISPDILLNYIVQRGLLSGGTYGLVVNPYDWLGRKWFSQSLEYFTIPSIIQSQAIGASTIEITIDPSATFPSEVKYIVFGITAETTQTDYLDWIVDSVKYVDNTGEEVLTPDGATQIKIYYSSIIEFSKQNNYNTTTGWQFIPTGTDTPEVADKIQFFINGDGKFFTKTITSLVKYDKDGQYILIDYTSDLKDLKSNAYIRLIRPKVCTGSEPSYEICTSKVDIVNGKATRNRFILNAFDTYYLSRQIPVPVPVAPVPPATDITYINELRILGWRFEHHSPSNFWGYKIWNRGRLNVRNPYEAEILKPNEIQLSGTLSPNGQLTYLQNFDEDQKKDFVINNSGGIVYFIVKSGIICFITQFNNFITGYNDNLARVVNGNLQVPSGDSTFGNPERRTNGDYGCTLFDKNTIREREGLIHFLDSSRVAVLQHNFNDSVDVSRNNKANSTIVSWLQKKIKYIQEWNRTHDNKKFFHSVINPANFEYILSDFTLNSNSYVNQEREYIVSKHESIAFDMYGQVWKCFYSATPQYYGYIEGEKNGQQLFLFKEAIPYYQYRTNEDVEFGTVFGEEVERVYEFILTAEIMKKLRPLWLEVYCKDSGYFSDRIITESGQQSRILKPYFKQGEFMTAAPFLRDTNTPMDLNVPTLTENTVLEGTPLFGEWVKVRLIGYPESNTKYSQLSGVQVFLYGESNTGINNGK